MLERKTWRGQGSVLSTPDTGQMYGLLEETVVVNARYDAFWYRLRLIREVIEVRLPDSQSIFLAYFMI